MRPTPIIREDKIQAVANALPIEKKWTFEDANEDRDKINAAIKFLPITLMSDNDGLIQGEVLGGIFIGTILQVGTGISLSEYDPIIGEQEWDEFSKEENQTVIMTPDVDQDGSNIPLEFLPNMKFVLIPR